MSFDLAEPSVMLCVLIGVIVACTALDLPALATTLRFLRLKRRLAYARKRTSDASRQSR